MAPRDKDSDHKKLLELLPTVVPGTLYETIRQAFGFRQGSSVHQMIKRLRAAGYDLTRYDVEASRRDTSERKLESARKASAAFSAKALEKAKAKTPTKKNAKPEPVTVRVVEAIPGDWKMVLESEPHTKEASNLASWQVQVPAEGTVTLTWRVQVRH